MAKKVIEIRAHRGGCRYLKRQAFSPTSVTASTQLITPWDGAGRESQIARLGRRQEDELKGRSLLVLKTDPSFRCCCCRRDQLFDRGKNDREFFVVFLFETFDLTRKIGVTV